MKIEVKKPTEEELKEMKVETWGVWECEPSEFDWHYDDKETCYVLEGKVKVKSKEQEVEFGPGDLVVFPKGLDCKWKVEKGVRKHYKFGE